MAEIDLTSDFHIEQCEQAELDRSTGVWCVLEAEKVKVRHRSVLYFDPILLRENFYLLQIFPLRILSTTVLHHGAYS